MPFQAVNSIIPGGVGAIAGSIHPAAGAAARMLGLGKRRMGIRRGKILV